MEKLKTAIIFSLISLSGIAPTVTGAASCGSRACLNCGGCVGISLAVIASLFISKLKAARGKGKQASDKTASPKIGSDRQ